MCPVVLRVGSESLNLCGKLRRTMGARADTAQRVAAATCGARARGQACAQGEGWGARDGDAADTCLPRSLGRVWRSNARARARALAGGGRGGDAEPSACCRFGRVLTIQANKKRDAKKKSCAKKGGKFVGK